MGCVGWLGVIAVSALLGAIIHPVITMAIGLGLIIGECDRG